jgi:hypothetical protein
VHEFFVSAGRSTVRGILCMYIYIYVSRGTEELSFCVRVFCSGSLIIMDEFDPTSVPRETIKYAYLPCYFQVNVIVSFWFVFIICRSTYVQFLLERMPAEVEALLSSTAIGKDDHTGLEISSHELLDFDPKVAQLTLLCSLLAGCKPVNVCRPLLKHNRFSQLTWRTATTTFINK